MKTSWKHIRTFFNKMLGQDADLETTSQPTTRAIVSEVTLQLDLQEGQSVEVQEIKKWVLSYPYVVSGVTPQIHTDAASKQVVIKIQMIGNHMPTLRAYLSDRLRSKE